MQYGTPLCGASHNVDPGYKKYVGWQGTIGGDIDFKFLWEKQRLLMYQQKISQLLQGVSPDGRPIIVPTETIGSVLYKCYESNRPQVGDIYSRYIQEGIEGGYRNDVAEIVDRAINIIVSQIRNEYEITANNNKLTVWNSLYGDFNKQGLRAHPPIKIRKRRTMPLMFNMNY